MMTYSLNSTFSQNAESISSQGATETKSFLQEKCEWKNFFLLPDQNKLNQEISQLLKKSHLYKGITGEELYKRILGELHSS